MNFLQSSFFWYFCFTVIFLLSLDFWSWKSEVPISLLHFPLWVFYFIGLQIILAIALLMFTINYKKISEEEAER